MEFNFNDFISENKNSEFIINIGIIRNDLRNSIYYLSEIKNNNQVDNSRLLYLIKQLVIHYREAIKYLTGKNKKIVVDNLNDKPKLHRRFINIVKEGNPFNGSYIQNNIKPMRDIAVHYSSNDKRIIQSYKKISKKYIGKVIIDGENNTDIYYEFSDDIFVNIFFDEADELDYKNIIEVLSKRVSDLLYIIDYIIKTNIREYR